MITNSVVPIPKAPIARARSARGMRGHLPKRLQVRFACLHNNCRRGLMANGGNCGVALSWSQPLGMKETPMTATDPALTALAQGWCALSLLHGRIEAPIERALQARHDLSVREYSLLDVLSRQHDGEGGHLQMKQVADAVVLSQSATTRLVTRLEDRGLLSRYLCPTDRRGIYTNVSET